MSFVHTKDHGLRGQKDPIKGAIDPLEHYAHLIHDEVAPKPLTERELRDLAFTYRMTGIRKIRFEVKTDTIEVWFEHRKADIGRANPLFEEQARGLFGALANAVQKDLKRATL